MTLKLEKHEFEMSYSFHRKLKGDKALILIHLDNAITIFWFWPSSRGKFSSKVNQKLKTLGTLKIL